MLQNTEYQIVPYLKWLHRTNDFGRVMYRRELNRTKPAKLLLVFLKVGIIIQLLIGAALIFLGIDGGLSGGVTFGLVMVILYPFIWPYIMVLPIIFGRQLMNNTVRKGQINKSQEIFARHTGIKIAVAGSYGKTTMKELLATVLSYGFNVAATPANKNVSISHAKFADSLSGKEEILIIEYGEGEVGDVKRFADITHPTHGIITGIAPAHLDRYKTLAAAGGDIFSVADYLDNRNVYVNIDSRDVKPFLKKTFNLFGQEGALGWKFKNVQVQLTGTSFVMQKGPKSIALKSGLLGRHQVGFLGFVAAFALELGLSESKLVEAIAKTQPFEHRLKPYQLAGAWVIDDTYNGNIEGIRAGTRLLKDLPAARKIYVTPGLVDQGEENENVHKEMGKLIANSGADIVVLMKNSVTEHIKDGLEINGFKSKLLIEDDPLSFYQNLNHFVASGDIVLMQNDWPDNYS
ncbi:MAG TPA: Mur ligase family protein [Candidatus Saccharimonadales bacterium]|nr:Mur ligase family protein [Candidatus Saccharimonadales bacterium]